METKNIKDAVAFLKERMETFKPEIEHNIEQCRSYISKAEKKIEEIKSVRDAEWVVVHILRHAENHARTILDDVAALTRCYRAAEKIIDREIENLNHELLESELKRIRSGKVNKDNMVCDILETCVAEDGGYIPVIIIEGEKGYNKTDWNWGKDLNKARYLAAERNREAGISLETAEAIKIYSIFG